MYENLLTELYSKADENYRIFHKRLLANEEIEIMGVRTPILRSIAKNIIKGDWQSFLSEYEENNIYEITLLRGMVIAGAKCSFAQRAEYLRQFVPTINNWAVCDMVSGDIKDAGKYKQELMGLIYMWIKSGREFEVRFGIVTLMKYYINDEYIDKVIAVCDHEKHQGYYVKMALAWCLSECFVKYRSKTLYYLKVCSLDTFTYNKTLQKICESTRVSKGDKGLIRTMKRKG